MKKLKVSLAAMAVVLGLGSALVTSAAPKPFANKTWGKLANGTYVDVTGQTQGIQYDCTGVTGTCTATYPAAQNPNSNPASPLSIVAGTFSN
jgi:hypothetical protein